MICSKCGAEIRDDARICVKCGTPVSGSKGVGEKENHYPGLKNEDFADLQKEAPKAKPRELAMLAVLVALVLIGIGLLVWRFTREEAPPPPPPKPKVVKKVRGVIDQAALQKFMKEHKPEAVACYADALKKKPKLMGTVEIKLKVDTKGKVISPQLSKNIEDAPDVGQCVLKKLSAWQFPAAKNAPVSLLQSFTFTPDDVKALPGAKKGKKRRKSRKRKGKK
ncbi:MAG: AgmX/PglI C-terminal domain-containing protein [Deltaproteobacteria bacterium]|nr:AgmX/PglI C-terminal domain-containing protein [Deltaproteobacteria bacterium]